MHFKLKCMVYCTLYWMAELASPNVYCTEHCKVYAIVLCTIRCTWLLTHKGIWGSLQCSVQYSIKHNDKYHINEAGREMVLRE